jgi:hypothetical protein
VPVIDLNDTAAAPATAVGANPKSRTAGTRWHYSILSYRDGDGGLRGKHGLAAWLNTAGADGLEYVGPIDIPVGPDGSHAESGTTTSYLFRQPLDDC